MNRYFAARGWILAVLFTGLVAARFASDAPLQPQFLIFLAAGVALRLWTGAHLGTHGNGARPEAPALAITGPYAFSRNPLYLSNLAVAAGLVFFANALSGAAAAGLLIVLFLHHLALAKWEENRLKALHGGAYANYAGRVPRWFSFRPPEHGEPGPENAEVGGNPKGREGGVSLREALARQGRNVVYALVCGIVLWMAGR